MTLVSVGMPLYNEERFLPEALESLLSQTHRDLHMVLSDNASTDRTAEICRDYAARDPRLTYVRQERSLGAVEHFFRVLDLSNGPYFMWGAGHDLWAPGFVESCAAVLDSDEFVGLCYPRARWIDLHGKTLRDRYSEGVGTQNLGLVARFNSVLWRSNYCTSLYGLFRASVLKRLRTRPHTMGWDKVILTELSFYSAFVELPETLFFMRETRPEEIGGLKAKRQFEMVASRKAGARPRPQTEKALAFARMLARADVGVSQKLVCLPSLALAMGVRHGKDFVEELAPRWRR